MCILVIARVVTHRYPMGSKSYKIHLKESYRDIPANPFTRTDYLLCALAYVLLAVAWIPAFAAWFVPR
jgi:hypothetical protein